MVIWWLEEWNTKNDLQVNILCFVSATKLLTRHWVQLRENGMRATRQKGSTLKSHMLRWAPAVPGGCSQGPWWAHGCKPPPLSLVSERHLFAPAVVLSWAVSVQLRVSEVSHDLRYIICWVQDQPCDFLWAKGHPTAWIWSQLCHLGAMWAYSVSVNFSNGFLSESTYLTKRQHLVLKTAVMKW